jgi:hypothetical protein
LTLEGIMHTVRNTLTRARLLMITSRLSSKAQTTIPQPIRTALQLRIGDILV